MKIAILHLSDIHIKDSDSLILDKAENIGAAVQEQLIFCEACFVLVTGDIAWSGLPSQYTIAREFFRGLIQKIQSLKPGLQIQFIIIPGNHDCNFDRQTQLRQMTISQMASMINDVGKGDDSIIDAMVEVQNDFFEFLAAVENTSPEKTLRGAKRLYYERVFRVGKFTIRFDCYNMAWLSLRYETPAHLLFPVHIVRPTEEQCDLVIAGLHHPTPWAQPNNARELRDHLEMTADIVFTGHEHVTDGIRKERPFLNTVTNYIEAPALQASDTAEVGFNLVELDIAENEHRISYFQWNKERYVASKQTPWAQTRSGTKKGREIFRNTADWNAILDDPGAPFSHRYKTTPLTLGDIYVYPNLDIHISGGDSHTSLLNLVRGKDVLRFILESPLLIVTGDTFSGKTSLWKSVYREFQRENRIPVTVRGGEIRSTAPEKLLKLIHGNFTEQYGPEMLDVYKQIELGRRVLILEDFHRCPLTTANKVRALEAIQKVCGHLLVLANPIFLLEEVAMEKEKNEGRNLLLSFKRASIKELGHLLRDRLINKWYWLGRESTGNEDDIQYQCRQAASFINTLRETGSVPSYPIFILTMLQALETGQSLKTSGEYGYFYEHLILQRLSVNVTPLVNMDLLRNYIPYLAWHLYCAKKESLSIEEFEKVTEQYSREYSLSIPRALIKEILTGSLILQDDRNGGYRFCYKHTYYYFTARYLANHVSRREDRKKIRSRISQMVKHLQAEENASIIIFYLYLTQDEEVITQLRKQANELYANVPLCDLDRQTQFIKSLTVVIPDLELPETTPQEHRARRLETLDEIENGIQKAPFISEEESREEKQELAELITLNTALKTIQVLGQVLRNFPGGLQGSLKEKLAEDCYLLGARTMSVILSNLEKTGNDLCDLLLRSLRLKRKDDDERELVRRTEEIFYLLTLGIIMFSIKNVSDSVGTEMLKETYKAIGEKYEDSLMVKFIDLSIKLDFFQNCPVDEILEAEPLVRDNDFTLNMLKLLVVEHFSLYKRPAGIRQKVCDRLGIKHNSPKLLQAST